MNIFYHMYCINDCLERFNATFKKIKTSQLYYVVDTVHVNMVGDVADKYYKFLNNCDSKINITKFSSDTTGEMDTINYLYDVANNFADGTPILYLHSKGVSRTNNANVNSWINYMEYFLIDNWKLWIEKLLVHDTCGVNLQHAPGKHYSGNFWWTKADYLKKLLRFDVQNCKVSYCTNNPRSYCEFWLLDNNFCNPCSLHDSNVDHYSTLYNESKYKL